MTLSPESIPDPRGEPRSRYMIDCAGAHVHVHARTVATVLRIEGEIDGSNADQVAQVIRRFARLKAPLVLDVSDLDFLGSAGLRVLLILNEEHRQAQLHCNVVGGRALHRLTRVVTDHGLPTVNTVSEALQNSHDFISARRRVRRHQRRHGELQPGAG